MDLDEIFTWPPTPAKWRKLKDFLKSIRITGGLGVRISKDTEGMLISAKPGRRGGGGGSSSPFTVTLHAVTTGETTTYKVSAKAGWVIETVPKTGVNALVEHPVTNQEEEADPQPTPAPEEPLMMSAKFDIEAGQIFAVKYTVDNNGKISPESIVYDVIEGGGEGEEDPERTESVHYIPQIVNGDSGGSAGTMYVPLAKLVAGEGEGAKPKLEAVRNTGHISHDAELAVWENIGSGQGRIVKQYNGGTGRYEMRTIRELASSPAVDPQIRVIEEGDTVLIRGNSKRGRRIILGQGGGESGSFSWQDGLLESEGEETIQLTRVDAADVSITVGGAQTDDVKIKGGGMDAWYRFYDCTLGSMFPIRVQRGSEYVDWWFFRGVWFDAQPEDWDGPEDPIEKNWIQHTHVWGDP